MKKSFLNEEKGIALTIAVIITFILMSLALAYFISVQSSVTNTMAGKSKVESVVVSNAGAERAIWHIQQQLDSNPNWQPRCGEVLFRQENPTVNYDELKKERDPAKYKNYGISFIKNEGGSFLYASKMVHKNDPTTPEDEWEIYTIGVMRTPSLLQKTAMSTRQLGEMKVLIQLGRGIGFPNGNLVTNDAQVTTNGRTVFVPHVDRDGNPDTDANVIVNDGIDETTGLVFPRRRGRYNGQVDPCDNYYGKFNYITAESSVPTKLQTAADNPTSQTDIKIQTGVSPTNIPSINLDYFKDKADYTGDELVRDGLFDVKIDGDKKVYYPKAPSKQIVLSKTAFKYDTTMSSRAVDYHEQSPPPRMSQEEVNLFNLRTINLYDRKIKDGHTDGLTIIYFDGALRIENPAFPSGVPNPGISPDILIRPEANAIIVTRGSWTNTYSPIGSHLYPNEYLGDKAKKNENMGIDIRESISQMTEDGRRYDMKPNSLTGMYRGGSTIQQVEERAGVKDSQKPGILDLLSDYDIAINPSFVGPEWSGYIKSWRGLIYSNKSVHLNHDIYLKGSIVGKENVIWADQGTLGHLNGGSWQGNDPWNAPTWRQMYGDGEDVMVGYENIAQRPGSDFYAQIIGGGGVGGNRMRIIAMEQIL